MERYKTKKIIFIFLSYFLIANSVKTFSTILNVDNANAIQKSFDLAKAHDTIVLESGTYAINNLIINKPLSLYGKGNPILDGQNKYQLLSVFSSNVLIEGLTFINCGISSINDLAGIKVYISTNVIIRGNQFKNMFFGIYFQECTNCSAINNIINSNAFDEVQSGNGIHCWKSSEMKILNNKVSGHRDGIYFEFVTHSLIEGNVSENNIRYGLHFMFSHNNSYLRNTFQFNGAGVAVMYTHHVIMKENIFKDNWGSASYGLLMKDISDSEVKHNTFSKNTSGIYLEGSNRNIIENNIFSNNGCALRIQASCDANIIEKNNFISNTFDVTTNGSLVQNKFNSNYWDKYEGYDLNKDKIGDVPYHPISLYSMIIERMPVASIFLRSFMVTLMDRTEKAIPSLTPENFQDEQPKILPYRL
jgi:nitrous oxidase accessory protein